MSYGRIRGANRGQTRECAVLSQFFPVLAGSTWAWSKPAGTAFSRLTTTLRLSLHLSTIAAIVLGRTGGLSRKHILFRPMFGICEGRKFSRSLDCARETCPCWPVDLLASHGAVGDCKKAFRIRVAGWWRTISVLRKKLILDGLFLKMYADC